MTGLPLLCQNPQNSGITLNPPGSGGVLLMSTILLPWVAWNAERSTPPFLCAETPGKLLSNKK